MVAVIKNDQNDKSVRKYLVSSAFFLAKFEVWAQLLLGFLLHTKEMSREIRKQLKDNGSNLGSPLGGLSFLLNFGQPPSLLFHFLLFLLFNFSAEALFFILLHLRQSLVFLFTEDLSVGIA